MAVLQSQLNHDHKQNDQDNKSDSDLLHSITLRDSDERATANLDTANGQQAMDIMWRLTEQTGTAFVLATHHSRIVAYARRVIKLRDGRIDGNGANA